MNMTLKQMLAELHECLNAEIKARGEQGRYCTVAIQPGNAVVFDFGDEDCLGMAWVRLVSANPTATFPSPATGLNNCALTLAYTVEMGIIGPAPQVDEQLNTIVLPSEEELFDTAMRQADELQMMYDAIRKADIPEKIIGDYVPQGPDGGVLGGTWTVIVGGDD